MSDQMILCLEIETGSCRSYKLLLQVPIDQKYHCVRVVRFAFTKKCNLLIEIGKLVAKKPFQGQVRRKIGWSHLSEMSVLKG